MPVRRPVALAAVTVPVALVAFLAGATTRAHDSIDLFNQVFRLVATTAVDSVPVDSLYQLAARGLVHEIGDPYADILSPEERAAFERNQLGNRYAGTGMTIRTTRGAVTAYRVFPGSPAAQAGIEAGDRLVRVDSTSIIGWAADSVTTLLLGPPGTPVTVTVERAGVTTPISATLHRAVIRVAAVPYTYMLDHNIGYIPITRFNDVAAADVARAVLQLEREGAKGFVLDLRGNGGGDLFQSLRMAGLFLPTGSEIARVKHRGKPAEIYRAEQQPLLTDAPIAVLVDGGTASASEIVSGSLQDQDRALIVGSRTFGKGLVQTQVVLNNDWAVRLTTGKWYTPSGRSIQAEHLALGDGHFVEDSLADGHRPTYHSASGRPIIGGGGVTPDLIVTQDTVSAAERALARALGSRVGELSEIIFEVARGVAREAPDNFIVQPAWREQVWAKVDSEQLPASHTQFVAARATIDRLLEGQVAGLIAGDSAAFARRLPHDRVLQAALTRVRTAGKREQLLGLN
jgi:carboxyl-terminal processing protease